MYPFNNQTLLLPHVLCNNVLQLILHQLSLQQIPFDKFGFHQLVFIVFDFFIVIDLLILHTFMGLISTHKQERVLIFVHEIPQNMANTISTQYLAQP